MAAKQEQTPRSQGPKLNSSHVLRGVTRNAIPPGTVSLQCQNNRHSKCYALECTCTCGHPDEAQPAHEGK